MKALAGALIASLAAGLVQAVVALAQPPAQGNSAVQQQSYRRWLDTDTTLERDAASAGATLGARADKVAAEAAKYFSLRKDYLEGRAADARRVAALLDSVNVAPDALPNLDQLLTAEDTVLRSTIGTVAHDPDRAIQLLRASLERERAAIAAIGTALKDSQKSQEAAVQTSRTAEEARAKTLGEYQMLAASLEESAQLTEKSGTTWAGYYRDLSDAARGAVAPVTSAGPALPSVGRGPAAVEPPKPDASSAIPAAAPVPVPATPITPASATTSPPAAATDTASAASRPVPPLPLARYVGSWTYPTVGAHYHGMQPESADLTVREENGQASGTLTARFRLPAGSTGNPAVRLDFAGAFGSMRAQKFAVTAANGATGTLELIPGPAFNLLEVNFRTDGEPGMIRQGNFLLIRK